jgi:hypothetical protein
VFDPFLILFFIGLFGAQTNMLASQDDAPKDTTAARERNMRSKFQWFT